MRNSRAVFLLLCLLGAAAISACGDDGEPGAPPGDFISQADEVCTEAAGEEIANPQPTPVTAEETVPVLEVMVQRREELLDAYRDLGPPPPGIADDWNRVFANTKQRYRNAQELLKLAERGMAGTAEPYVALVSESSELGDESEAILAELGSTSCARVLGPADRREVVDFVTAWETQPFDDCEEVTTQHGIESVFGSVERCEAGQQEVLDRSQLQTQSIEVTDVEGIAEVTATVDATLAGGANDGLKVRYLLLFEDGTYKVDSVTLQPGET